MQSSSAPIKISDSEWEIMRVIWTLGKSDAQEVTALLSESKDWKTATVKTLLGRLVKKRRIADRNPRKKNLFIILWFPRMLRFKVPQRVYSLISVQKSAKHWQK